MNFDDLVKKKRIFLRHKGMPDGDLDELIRVIRETHCLEELLLDGNKLTLTDGGFADALAHNRTIEALSLINNDVHPEGAKKLAAALKVNGTLQRLNLSHNPIGDEGAKILAEAFRVNKSLVAIAMWGNEIGDEGARSLAASFEMNRSLVEVDLFDNKITEKGAQMLADSLGKNYNIGSLSVRDPEECKVQSDINDALKSNERKISLMKAKILGQDEEIAALQAALDASREEIRDLKNSLKAPLKHMESIIDAVATS